MIQSLLRIKITILVSITKLISITKPDSKLPSHKISSELCNYQLHDKKPRIYLKDHKHQEVKS